MYAVPVTGGEYTPLSHSDSASVYGVSYSPKDDRILFRMDDNGNELLKLYMMDQQGSVKSLTPEAGARTEFYGWSHDGDSFFFGSNKRDNRYMDVYEMNTGNFKPTLLYQNDAGYSFGGISPDKRYMALSKAITTSFFICGQTCVLQ